MKPYLKDCNLLMRVILNYMAPLIRNDETFLRLKWKLHKMPYQLNLNTPKTFNEKMHWIKLNVKNPMHITMVDKADAKKFVRDKIGNEYIVPTYGVYNSVEEIDFDKLPNQFVLKCTHDSGGVVICEDKGSLDKKAAIKKIEKALKKNYYYRNREWPYRQLKPRIIAEKYLVDESGWQLKDYKIFCFNGVPRFIEVDYDRYVGHKLNVYDLDWNFMDFYMTSPNDKEVIIERPAKLEKMLEIARILSKDTIFLRVDLYSIQDKIYFGELTFTPGSGMIDFHPRDYDLILGEMLKLPFEK